MLSLVVGHAMRLVDAGVAIGLGLSLLVTGSLAQLLFDVGPATCRSTGSRHPSFY